jgi:GNAT superfamily N-acetyltransferase
MIRPATPGDAARIGRLQAEVHRATYEPLIDGPYGTPPTTDWPAILAGPDLVFVAVVDSALVGFGLARGDRIETLYVAPSHQRRGIGQALFRRLLQGLHARAIPAARFNVLARNARAIAFYEALGARQVGTEVMTDAPLPYLDVVFRIEIAI